MSLSNGKLERLTPVQTLLTLDNSVKGILKLLESDLLDKIPTLYQNTLLPDPVTNQLIGLFHMQGFDCNGEFYTSFSVMNFPKIFASAEESNPDDIHEGILIHVFGTILKRALI